jgi:hypothetical protein
MERNQYPDNAFAYLAKINGEDYRLLLHHNEQGEPDIELIDFGLSMVDHVSIIDSKNEVREHLLQDKAECLFKSDSVLDMYQLKTEYHSFRANIDGVQQTPPNDSKGKGTARCIYHHTSKTMFYDVRFEKLSADETVSHLHIGARSKPGPIAIPLPAGNPKTGFVQLNKDQENALFAGMIFVNIHSGNFPEGEIRGQLMPHPEIDTKSLSEETKRDPPAVPNTERPPSTLEQIEREKESQVRVKESDNVNSEKKDKKKKKKRDVSYSVELSESVKWTRAFINDLPDSSFAVIEKGGKKDDEGKTTPRNYRHLPFEGSEGKVDLPHLRNAFARMSQIKSVSPDDNTERIRSVAKRVLTTSAKKNLPDSQSAKSSEDEVNVEEIVKGIDNIVVNSIVEKICENPEENLKDNNICGTEAALVDVQEEGSVKFFTIKVGDPDFPIPLFFDVIFDGNGDPQTVKMLSTIFPVDVIPDVMKFLRSLVKMKNEN